MGSNEAKKWSIIIIMYFSKPKLTYFAFSLQRKNAFLLTDKYLSKIAFFLTGITLDQKISFSVNLLT